MYIVSVVALLFVLPVVSVLVELALGRAFSADLVRMWFVFWSVGVRLLLAGLRQTIQPSYTAEKILGIKAPEAAFVVRELGFANIAIGFAGVASLFATAFRLPLALIGAIFYGLAGCNHLLHEGRKRLQNVAMISDLVIAGILQFLLSEVFEWAL